MPSEYQRRRPRWWSSPGRISTGLGEELKKRAEDVLRLTVSRTTGPDHAVDAVV